MDNTLLSQDQRMGGNTLFSALLESGKPIRPFMVSGVLEKDYPGERTSQAVQAYVEETLHAAAQSLLGRSFREFDTFTLGDVQGRWLLCDALSPRYAAGNYYIMEKMAMMPIYLEFDSPCEQEITLRICAGRLVVLLGGEIVFDNDDYSSRKRERTYVFEHVNKPNYETIKLHLKAGRNSFAAVTGHVGRGTGISFSMELLSCEQPLHAVVPINMPADVREEIAYSQMETHLVDDCYLLGETPVLHIGRMPLKHCCVLARLMGEQGEIMRADGANASGLSLPSNLAAGQYSVEISWQLPGGEVLTAISLAFCVVETVAPNPGYDQLPQRRAQMLKSLAERGDVLALYRLGRQDEIDIARVEAMCDKINRRKDCADFDLLPLLWLVWEDRQAQLLAPRIHELVREAAIGFRYWVDEPGTSSMFYCSENHRIGFHVCEYLAGLLYPTDLFTNCEQNGMYHSLKGRMHLVEWLNQRCRVGFDEPHSETYLPVTLSAILVLREVLPMEEYPLRNMVNILLDFMVYLFAVSSFDGVMATPRGRSYNKPLRTGLLNNANGVFWLLFGNAPASINSTNAELAFSCYMPPRGICMMADDFTPATFTFKQGIMHFDKHNADFTIYRTPDYMIGGVRDHNVGMCDMHFIPAMIALRKDITVFFSSPNNVAEGSGQRPDYWAGHAFLPRVLMAKRTLAVIWHDVNDNDIWMTHCHFNKRKFDEVVSRDQWTFGRSGDGYVGIYSSAPHSFRAQGPYAGRELICDGNEVVWLAECGSRAEDGSFEAFIDRLVHATLWQDGCGFHFDSPGSGLMEFGLSDGFTIDRQEVAISGDMASSPYLRSRYGSGRFEYSCPAYKITQWSYPATE